MKALGWLSLIAAFLLATACSGSKMTVPKDPGALSRAVGRLAIAPGSGVLGEAISMELFARGITVVDAQEATAIVGRAGLGEFEVTSTKGFAVLRDKGIDAV